ncbi:uncharacterized protein TNCV_2256611 [Trichonephila clavipes]|nr:uncharacterized protein TNCV_2256611 [Trichonephila clavipes]
MTCVHTIFPSRKSINSSQGRTNASSFVRREPLLAQDSTATAGCGSPGVKVSDHGRHVMSSSPVPLKTHRVGQRCTLNLSRAEASSRWCGVVW